MSRLLMALFKKCFLIAKEIGKLREKDNLKNSISSVLRGLDSYI